MLDARITKMAKSILGNRPTQYPSTKRSALSLRQSHQGVTASCSEFQQTALPRSRVNFGRLKVARQGCPRHFPVRSHGGGWCTIALLPSKDSCHDPSSGLPSEAILQAAQAAGHAGAAPPFDPLANGDMLAPPFQPLLNGARAQGRKTEAVARRDQYIGGGRTMEELEIIWNILVDCA
jgi:hypothetical protein